MASLTASFVCKSSPRISWGKLRCSKYYTPKVSQGYRIWIHTHPSVVILAQPESDKKQNRKFNILKDRKKPNFNPAGSAKAGARLGSCLS